MARRRVTRKEMKQPDEFQSFWNRIYLDFTDDPRRFLAPVGIGILVLAIVVGGGYWLKSYRASVRADFSSAVEALSTATEPSALEALATRFESVSSRSFLSPIGKVAVYYRAAALARAGKYAEAIEIFNQFTKTVDGKDPLRFEAVYATARCMEAVGRRDEAAKSLEALADDPDNPIAPAYLYAIGSIRESAGDPKGATEIYRRLVQKHPEAPQIADAKARLEELSGQAG